MVRSTAPHRTASGRSARGTAATTPARKKPRSLGAPGGCRRYALRQSGVGSVLEVVLDDLGGQGRAYLHALGPDGAHDFSAANDLG